MLILEILSQLRCLKKRQHLKIEGQSYFAVFPRNRERYAPSLRWARPQKSYQHSRNEHKCRGYFKNIKIPSKKSKRIVCPKAKTNVNVRDSFDYSLFPRKGGKKQFERSKMSINKILTLPESPPHSPDSASSPQTHCIASGLTPLTTPLPSPHHSPHHSTPSPLSPPLTLTDPSPCPSTPLATFRV